MNPSFINLKFISCTFSLLNNVVNSNCYLWISEHKSREADKGMYGYLLHMQKSRIKAVNYEVLFEWFFEGSWENN